MAASPAACCNTMRTVMAPLPCAANSGQYVATGLSRSSLPCATSMCAHNAAAPLVQENTSDTVSRFQGVTGAADKASAWPPQASSTGCPCNVSAMEAPISLRERKFSTKASNTGRYAGAQKPLTTAPLGPVALTAGFAVAVQRAVVDADAPPQALSEPAVAAPSSAAPPMDGKPRRLARTGFMAVSF